ncbi:hypothetical protein [Oleidesulfovibrio sp.]|uniref:hypothetical protein n=1 Tax=Oleidesulfovibrio sp. TaxID=2909707 RepID=UPI003A872556
MIRELLKRKAAIRSSILCTGTTICTPYSRRNRSTVLGIAILIGVLILFASVVTYVADTQSAPPPPLLHHTVLLLDRTDPLPPEINALVASRLERLKQKLPTGAMLTVAEINATSGGNLKPLIQLRKPRSIGSMTTENVEKIASDYKQTWEQRIDALSKQLTTAVTESIETSPIMETTQRLEDLPEYSAAIPRRELIIISDMLQNSRIVSVYKNELFFSDMQHSIWPDFSNIHVTVYQVTRTTQNNRSKQTFQLNNFWKDFFLRCGATVEWHIV